MKSLICVGFAVLLTVTLIIYPDLSALADTIRVPADQPTIQDGIDAAAGGDLVLVAPGTYIGKITIGVQEITLQSEGGAAATVLDGNGGGPGVVEFSTATPLEPVIDGFTIRNGYAQHGAGIGILNGIKPVIKNCIITNNTAEYTGGGIFIAASSSATILNCTITDNYSGSHGGGLLSSDFSDPVIKNCVFSGNSANYISGGFGGGGAALYRSYALFENCIISDNTSTGPGGGVYLYNDPGSPTFINCTFVDNHSNEGGGGLADFRTGDSSVMNCIFWGNTATPGAQLWVRDGPWSELTVSYCDVQGGLAAVYVYPGGILNWLAGNMDTDPLFETKGDYELADGSPCIDAGNTDSSYDDLCFPPSKGADRNDMGTYGGPGACGGSGPEGPTLIELASLEAVSSGPSALVRWETLSEIDNEGFHLWKAESGEAEFTRITTALIPSEGGPTWGARYEFVDGDVLMGHTYFYRLEAMDIYGLSTFHGPVEVLIVESGCFIFTVM